MHSQSLPEVVDLARLHKYLPAGGGVHLVDPELELGPRHRAEGGGVEVGQRGQGQNGLHPFRGQMQMGGVGYQNEACRSGTARRGTSCQRVGRT